MLKFVFVAAACLPLLSAGDFFPLEEGNSWTYRRSGAEGEFTVRVGAPQTIDKQAYYPLSGYVAQTVLVRSEAGVLYYRDGARNTDVPLTSFVAGQSFSAPLRQCAEEGTPEQAKDDYQGPAGHFSSPMVIEYRILNCADAGVTDETYAENIGMVRRTETSIAGPRAYDLVSARIGNLSIAAAPQAMFQVRLASLENTRLVAGLQLSLNGGAPLTLTYMNSQEYDLAVRGADGKTLLLWSQGRPFLQVVRQLVVNGGLSYSVELPLTPPLAPGRYKLEGRLTSDPGYTAALSFEVPGVTVNSTIPAVRFCFLAGLCRSVGPH